MKTFGFISYGDTYVEAKKITVGKMTDLKITNWEEYAVAPSRTLDKWDCTCDRCSRWGVGAKWKA